MTADLKETIRNGVLQRFGPMYVSCITAKDISDVYGVPAHKARTALKSLAKEGFLREEKGRDRLRFYLKRNGIWEK